MFVTDVWLSQDPTHYHHGNQIAYDYIGFFWLILYSYSQTMTLCWRILADQHACFLSQLAWVHR